MPPSVSGAGPSVESGDIAKLTRKLEKKIRETLVLQQQQAQGRALTPEELAKVRSLAALEAQVAPLRLLLTRNDTSAGASASSAGTAAASFVNARAALSALPDPPTQAGARASHIAIAQRYRLNPKDEKLKTSLKLKTGRSSLEHYAPKTYLR